MLRVFHKALGKITFKKCQNQAHDNNNNNNENIIIQALSTAYNCITPITESDVNKAGGTITPVFMSATTKDTFHGIYYSAALCFFSAEQKQSKQKPVNVISRGNY